MPKSSHMLDHDAHRLAESIARQGGVIRGGTLTPTQQRAIDLGLVVRMECESERWRATPSWRKGSWLVLDAPLTVAP